MLYIIYYIYNFILRNILRYSSYLSKEKKNAKKKKTRTVLKSNNVSMENDLKRKEAEPKFKFDPDVCD